MRKLAVTVALICTSALSATASAALLNVTVTGTVLQSQDQFGNGFGAGVGSDTVAGQAIVVSYLINTAAAPPVANPSPITAQYGGPGCNVPGVDWITGGRVTVGGVAIGRQVDAGNISNCDSLLVQDSDVSFFPDAYSLDSIASSSSFEFVPGGYISTFAFDFTYAAVFSITQRFIDGLSPTQSFIFAALPTDNTGATLNRSGTTSTCDLVGNCTVEQWDFRLNYQVSTFSVTPVGQVPEPPVLGLLAAAGLGVVAARRRRQLSA